MQSGRTGGVLTHQFRAAQYEVVEMKMKKQPQNVFIGLVRGINVGGRNMIPMAELRTGCNDLGWSHVQTYIRGGSRICRSASTEEKLEADLEHAIRRHFGLSVAVLVRKA